MSAITRDPRDPRDAFDVFDGPSRVSLDPGVSLVLSALSGFLWKEFSDDD